MRGPETSDATFEVLLTFDETLLCTVYLGPTVPCQRRLVVGDLEARWHQGQIWLRRPGEPQALPLPAGAATRLQLAHLTLLCRPSTPPAHLVRPGVLGATSWSEGRCALWSVLGHALLLLLIFSVPRHEVVRLPSRLIPANVRSPVLGPDPQLGRHQTGRGQRGKGGGQGGGEKGIPAPGADGPAGLRTSPGRDGAAAVQRRPNQPRVVRLPSKRMTPKIDARQAGILGIFRAERSTLGAVTSIESAAMPRRPRGSGPRYARGSAAPDPARSMTSALGDQARDALGNLQGSIVADAAGLDGLGLRGTGPGAGCLVEGRCSTVGSTGLGLSGTRMGGGGTGEGTISLGGSGGIGVNGDDRRGFTLAGGPAELGDRRSGVPGPAVRMQIEARDGLSAQRVRRVIRRHLDEVKYCYEKELTVRPELFGRVVLSLVISPAGPVVQSSIAHSTLGHPRAESCIASAARRWPFPPAAGVTRVTYPIVLNAAGR